MSPFEFIGELCTFDSALIRGWRWLVSAEYRKKLRDRYRGRSRLFIFIDVSETVLLMLAEVVAVVFIAGWLRSVV